MGVNFEKFIKKYLGKATDVDGSAGVQCVDLAKAYLKEVFDIPFFAVGSAKNYFERFDRFGALRDKFERIANTPDFVPLKGDLAVWGSSKGGGHGHVAICSGEGDTRHFYSYDQNWDGKACKLVRHDYRGFLGVLRPRCRVLIGSGETAAAYYPKYSGSSSSLVDALESLGVTSSFNNRRKIARANGVNGYVGTAAQNIKLLALLRTGQLRRA